LHAEGAPSTIYYFQECFLGKGIIMKMRVSEEEIDVLFVAGIGNTFSHLSRRGGIKKGAI
jgi:hypothetical protein